MMLKAHYDAIERRVGAGGETLQRNSDRCRPLIRRTVHAWCRSILSRILGAQVRYRHREGGVDVGGACLNAGSPLEGFVNRFDGHLRASGLVPHPRALSRYARITKNNIRN